MNSRKIYAVPVAALLFFFVANIVHGDEEGTKNVLKQGLLGAGTGAIASGASGGNAGTGALIGAGTGVIGGALLDAITTPSTSSSRSSRKSASSQQAQYYDDEEDPDDGQEYYEEEPPQESTGSKVIKQGLLGAGTGAIAAGASGGDAGKGALIGAGTGIIGGILLDSLTQPSQPKKVYKRRPQAVTQQIQTQQNVKVEEEQAGSEGGKKKIIKKYDPTGKLVSEEEVYY